MGANDNLGHNILKLYNVVVQILLTTSKRKPDIYYSKLCVRVASRVAQRLNASIRIPSEITNSPTPAWLTAMAESTTKISELSFDETMQRRKKKDLVSEIEKLKGKVVVDNTIKNLCDQVSRLSENLAKLMKSN